MNAAIIDDELDNRTILQHFILQYEEQINIIGQANSVKSGLKLINEFNPDVIFLDIEMPDGSGFDLINKFEQHIPEIIFCTAYNQFAIKAIECSALAYILKPVTQENVFNALKRAKIKVTEKHKVLQYEILNEQLQNNIAGRFIVTNSDGMHVVHYNHVICCIAHSNYTDIYLTESRRITISKTLKEIEFILSKYSKFIRIHHSSIINIEHINKVSKTENYLSVLMINEIELSVSRSKKDAFGELIYGNK